MEADLIGDFDSLPYILWSKYFIEAQGYILEYYLLHQDNHRQCITKQMVKHPVLKEKIHKGEIFYQRLFLKGIHEIEVLPRSQYTVIRLDQYQTR